MKIPAMIGAELRRLVSTKMSIIALIALLCVPILYGGLYLWANQDPYGNLSRVPVALVVDDAGASVNDEPRNIGDEVAQELIDDGTFDWRPLSKAEAEEALAHGEVDFVVEIPRDFSEAIASIASGKPRPADIVLHTNDANNYLATTIGTQATEKIRATVAEKVIREAGKQMLDGIHTVRGKIGDAADGAGEIFDGLGTAHSGTGKLIDGTSALQKGASALTDGAGRLADGTSQLNSAAQNAASASNRAIAKLPAAKKELAAALKKQGLAQDQIDEILVALDPVEKELRTANGYVQSASQKVSQLNDGAHALKDGAAKLTHGAGELHEGSRTLDSGLIRLKDGAGTLRDRLSDGVKELPNHDEATRDRQASTLGDPVGVSSTAMTEAQNYGAGLAPFFAALAAWIGIYALFLIVKPISRRAVTALHSPVRVTIAGWATPALLGGVQMVGLYGILAAALGFQFSHPVFTLGILLLASASYTAIILALNVWLGSVGQFMGLVLMVLQLVTAGGTFPWQTLPAPLPTLHHILPMSYVVDAMRQVMYGGMMERVGFDIGILACWLVGGLVLASLGVARMTRFRTMRDLQPSLIG